MSVESQAPGRTYLAALDRSAELLGARSAISECRDAHGTKAMAEVSHLVRAAAHCAGQGDEGGWESMATLRGPQPSG